MSAHPPKTTRVRSGREPRHRSHLRTYEHARTTEVPLLGTQHGPDFERFVASARKQTGLPIEEFDVFALGNSPKMTDELAALILSGRKRATADLPEPYEACTVQVCVQPSRNTPTVVTRGEL